MTEQHLLDWRDALLASKASRRDVKNGYIAAARAFFAWAKNEKKLTTNPAAEVFVTLSEKKKQKKIGFNDREAPMPADPKLTLTCINRRGFQRRLAAHTSDLPLHWPAR